MTKKHKDIMQAKIKKSRLFFTNR